MKRLKTIIVTFIIVNECSFTFIWQKMNFEMNNTILLHREPSSFYLHTSFLLIGIMQIINIFVCMTLILTIILNRTLWTIPNLLTMNSSFAILIYTIVIIIQLIVGMARSNTNHRYVCLILSYFTSIATDAICYSYLVTAVSQFFYNILYHQKYLLTFRMHWLIIFISWCISILLPLLLYLSGKSNIFAFNTLTGVHCFRCI